MLLLSSVDFAAFLSYTPRGTTEIAKKSKTLMYALKQDRPVSDPPIPMSKFIAQLIKDRLEGLPFANFFGPHVSLVPVPKSSPIKEKGTLWVPQRLVQALSQQGLGAEFNCLIRKEAVQKAAFAQSADRPKAIDHFRTMEIQASLEQPREILLVDDVVTTGATLLGSASLLQRAFPDAGIRTFAVLRTISQPDDFSRITSPCVGTIQLLPNGNTSRFP